MWDFTIQCDIKIEARRPNIVVTDKTKKEIMLLRKLNKHQWDLLLQWVLFNFLSNIFWHNNITISLILIYKEAMIVDVTTPGDVWVNDRDVGNIESWKCLIVISVVAGALGAIPTGFEKYIAANGIEMRVEHAQKTSLLWTARILRLVIGC